MSDEQRPNAGNAAAQQRKQRGRPFTPGRSGNPDGKRTGSRNKTTILLEKIMEADGKAVAEAVVKAAKEGDMGAARLVLDRLAPIAKGRRVRIELPPIRTATDIVDALGAVAAAMAEGEITPDEAQTIAGVLDYRRKAVETLEMEQRLTALEQRTGKP